MSSIHSYIQGIIIPLEGHETMGSSDRVAFLLWSRIRGFTPFYMYIYNSIDHNVMQGKPNANRVAQLSLL